jgi:P-type Mg2+ transporter
MRKALTQGFTTFLRRRHAQRHFARRPLLASLAAKAAQAKPVAQDKPVPEVVLLADDKLLVSHDEPAAAIKRLKSHESGLSAAEAAQRLLRDGPNEIEHEKPLPVWLHLWRCYLNPFNLLLTGLAALSYIGADAKATIVIGVMVALSTIVRFVQEGRSHRAAEGLRAMVSNTATVICTEPGLPNTPKPLLPPVRVEIAQRELVEGDLIALSAGDMIPADCRILTARDLFIDQAAMTGESLPTEKFIDQHGKSSVVLEQSNLIFMGTNVVSGATVALVVATGSRTYFGTLASRANVVETEPNAFQAGVNSVSWLLIRFALVMVPIVFLINGFTKGVWLQAFLAKGCETVWPSPGIRSGSSVH